MYFSIGSTTGCTITEKALVGAFSVIVQPVVEPMEHYTALPRDHCPRHVRPLRHPRADPRPGQAPL